MQVSVTKPKAAAVVVTAAVTYLGIQSIFPTVISGRAADGAFSVE